MRTALLFLLLSLLLFPSSLSPALLPLHAEAPCAAAVTSPVDMPTALEYCRRSPLERLEGIWEFPEDETRVLIRRTPGKKRGYDIIHLSGPDCRLRPGEVIGDISATAGRDNYRLSLHTGRRYGLLTDTRSCSAQFREKENALVIKPTRIKISTRTLWFLPRFWRSLRISLDRPADSLPLGLIRIYPVTLPENPIYL